MKKCIGFQTPVVGLIWLSMYIALGLLWSTELQAQCQKTGPYAVQPFQVFEFTIGIDSIAVDDLSDPLQGLCGVSIEYEHQSVSDMLIELESPAGQSITLVGPTANGALTFFTQWDISFIPCAATPDPDLNFPDRYSNLNSWGVLGEANGSYHPFSGCLEDFDTGTVTGEWIVKVRDQGPFYEGEIQSITLFFCNPAGLECLECAVPENTFAAESLQVCASDTAYTPPLDTANGFDSSFQLNSFLFQEGDSIVYWDTTFDLDSIAFGTYNLCLWTIERTDSIAFFGLLDSIVNADTLLSQTQALNICAVNGDCIELEWLEPPDTVFIDSIICDGKLFIFMGDTLQTTGNYSFLDTSAICPQSILVNLVVRDPMAVLLPLDTLSCAQSTVLADASDSQTADSTRYRWENKMGDLLGLDSTYLFSDSGEYRVTVSDGQCGDTTLFKVQADFETPFFSISGDTSLNCRRDSAVWVLDSLGSKTTFFWWIDTDTVFTDTLIITAPDSLLFFAVGANGCIDSQRIEIMADLRTPDFTIATDRALCPGDTVALSAIQDSTENYSYEWSGPDGFSSMQRDTFTHLPGLYILQATHPQTGCIGLDSLNLEQSMLPDLPSVSSDTLNCLQRSVQLELDTVITGWVYRWVDPIGDTLGMAEPTVDIAGLYTLQVSDPEACSDTLSYFVPETTNFPRYEIQPDTLGCTDSTAVVSVNFVTDSTGFQWSWEDPLGRVFDTTRLLTSLPGPYIFRLTNGNFCETRDTFMLVEDFTPFAHLLAADTLTCLSPTSQLTISGGTDDFDFSWSGPNGFSASGDTLTVSRPGPYTVAISSLNCFYERGIRLEIDTVTPMLDFELFPINCSRDTGRIQFPQTQLLRVERFNTDSSAFIDLPLFQYDYTSEQQGTFRWIGTNGCSVDSSIALPVDTIVEPVTINIDTFTCDRTSIQAIWSSPEDNIDARWTQSGTLVGQADTLMTADLSPVELELQFQNTCRFDTVLLPPVDTLAPDLQLSPQDLNCTRQAYDLNTMPDGRWRAIQWVRPGQDTLDNVFTIRIDQAGEYSWQLTGTNGCIRNSQFTIQQDTIPPDFQIQNTLIPCDQSVVQVRPEGDSSSLSSFQWLRPDGSTTDVWQPTFGPGDYVFRYEGKNTCIDSVELTVVQDEVQATVDNLEDQYVLDCNRFRDTLRPQINGQIDRFIWTLADGTLAVGDEIAIIDPGLYQLIIQERDICFDTLEIGVELDTVSPSISLSADTLTCNQPEIQADVNVQAEDPGFDWVGPNGFRASERAPLFPRPGKYTVTVTDNNGCFTVDSVEVLADLARPEFEIVDTFYVNCDRPIVQIGLSIESGQTLEWWDDGEVVSTDTTFEYPPGDDLIVAVTGNNGCVAIDTVYLSATPKFPSTEWDLPVLACDNLIDTIHFVDADGDYSYQWFGPDGFAFEGEEPTVRRPGAYIVQYTNANQCQTRDTLILTASSQPPQFQVQSTDTLRCLDSTANYQIDLSMPGDYIYQWSALSGEVVSFTNQMSAVLQGPGRFAITVQDRDSFCIARDTLALQFADPRDWPLAYRSYDQFCIEDTLRGIRIEGLDSLSNGPFTYLLDGDTVRAPSLSNLQPGVYNLSVYDRQGCAQDTSFEVRDRIDEQTVDIGDDGDVSLGQELSLLPQLEIPDEEIESWVWIVNTQDSCFQCLPFEWIIRGPTRIDYYLRTLGGCVLTDQINLLPPIEDLVFVPNIFSPNDDGVNDFFFIQTASEDLPQMDEIQIFNRSGNLIFERRDFPPNARDVGWDGMFRGQKQDPQVFTVLLKYTFGGEQRTEVHSLTLVR